METWGKLWCPACNTPNWICLGDLEDCTVPTTEAVLCHSCKKKFLIIDRNELMDMYGEDLKPGETLEDYCYDDEGRPSPN